LVTSDEGTLQEVKHVVMQSLDIGSEERSERYKGLPIYMGKSKVQTFNYLKGKL
jgi:hypothetical protein